MITPVPKDPSGLSEEIARELFTATGLRSSPTANAWPDYKIGPSGVESAAVPTLVVALLQERGFELIGSNGRGWRFARVLPEGVVELAHIEPRSQADFGGGVEDVFNPFSDVSLRVINPLPTRFVS